VPLRTIGLFKYSCNRGTHTNTMKYSLDIPPHLIITWTR
jgi:hypothetical protein